MPEIRPIAWPNPEPEHLPQGALMQPDGSVVWRLWAPKAERVRLITWPGGARTETEMTPHEYGYFTHRQHDVEEGLRYAYQIGNGPERPDPASRWQPDGVHKPSAVFYPETFAWKDAGWRGVPRNELVIYELHTGTFTPQGTFEAVAGRLRELRELGITAVEIMPVGQFSGSRNWGYDGVHPYAVQNTYGGPRELQRLVDAAHREGMGVFLDVVYNHFGPEGNYLGEFGPYFTDRYHTPWGLAVNFDGPDSDAVRQYVIENACMWARDFHVDGLRLDAVHAIFDMGARHILEDIQEAVQQVAARQERTVHVVAETNQNDVRQIHPPEQGGYGLDGVWSDDFHHSVHTVLTGERDGYYMDFGRPEHLAKAYGDVFVYDGCYSPFRRRRHGSRVGNLDRSKFVVSVKNHDQIGNRAQGERPFGFPEHKLAMGLLMLAPNVPLLFMGDEYFERRPFPFFCSFGDAGLIRAVREGRRQEFENLAFRWGEEIPDPQDPATFESAILTWHWPEGSEQAQMRRLFRDLLAARRRWPALKDLQNTTAQVAPAPDTPEESLRPVFLWIERGAGGDRLLACANLTPDARPRPPAKLDGFELILSTHERRYGGQRDTRAPAGHLHGFELTIYGPGEWRL